MSEWVKLEPITAGRMRAVWQVAKSFGYRRLDKFWDFAHEWGWDFYDVLEMAET